MPVPEFRPELERIRRVSDMLVTGHANLRDRYSRRATFLDLAVLALSTWLTAVSFSFALTGRVGQMLTSDHSICIPRSNVNVATFLQDKNR